MFKFAIAAAILSGAALVVLVSALGPATPARAASYPACLAGGSNNALRCGVGRRGEMHVSSGGFRGALASVGSVVSTTGIDVGQMGQLGGGVNIDGVSVGHIGKIGDPRLYPYDPDCNDFFFRHPDYQWQPSCN